MNEIESIKKIAYDLLIETNKLEDKRESLEAIEQFGAIFKAARQERQLTIEQVSSLSSISPKTIIKIEKRPEAIATTKIQTLRNLADIVGIEICIRL